jgi:glutathione S-transferase
MYTLYSKAGSCSMAVHVLLLELGQKVQVEPFKLADGSANPKLLAINPRGGVPAIQKGDVAMFEGGAILSWLCDEHDSPLMPRRGAARAKALQWLMFANATMHPAYGQAFFVNAQAIDQADKMALLNVIGSKVQDLWQVVDDQLAQGDYVCGNAMTVADILLSVIANWTSKLGVEVTFSPRLKAYFARVSGRGSFQEALAEEKIEYKAAA